MKTIGTSILWAALAVSANAGTLIHYYPFTVDASDQAGTDNGTLQGSASVSGGVLNLNGSTDYLDFAVNLIPGTGDFSVLMAAKLNFVGAPGSIYEMISQGGSGSAFYVGTRPTGVRVGDNWGSAFTGAYPSDGDWHWFGVTVDSVNDITRLYIDGDLVSSINIEIGHGTGGTTTRFGRQYNGHAEYWPGQLDNVRIYTGVLTDGEVQTLSGAESAVPEPWTMALTGAGLVAVGLRRRKAA